jgi:hypothetical protein
VSPFSLGTHKLPDTISLPANRIKSLAARRVYQKIAPGLPSAG